MDSRLFLRAKDIMNFEGCKKTSAYEKISYLKQLFCHYEKGAQIAISEYALYRGISEKKIYDALKAIN